MQQAKPANVLACLFKIEPNLALPEGKVTELEEIDFTALFDRADVDMQRMRFAAVLCGFGRCVYAF